MYLIKYMVKPEKTSTVAERVMKAASKLRDDHTVSSAMKAAMIAAAADRDVGVQVLEPPELRDPRRARVLLSCHVMHLCANLSDVASLSFFPRSV